MRLQTLQPLVRRGRSGMQTRLSWFFGPALICFLLVAQVELPPQPIACTLRLFGEVEARRPSADSVTRMYDLLACFWIVMKLDSVRGRLPSSKLVCEATHACPRLLCRQELSVLVLLDWRVTSILRASGL